MSLTVGPDGLARCSWCGDDPGYVRYHDEEWGRALRDERGLFERVVLEAFQAGLSWLLILRRREAFRAAFADFDPARVAEFGEDDVARLLADRGIVRNRAKITAAIHNAGVVTRLWQAGDDLTGLLWSFAPDGARRRPGGADAVPARTPESTAMAAELRRRGFRFVGPTSCYALMQAAGLVDDHIDGCHVPVPPPPRQPSAGSGGSGPAARSG